MSVHIMLAGSLSNTSVGLVAKEVKLPLRLDNTVLLELIPFISEQPFCISSSSTSLWPEVFA
jgi:hypothetical protein